jgi:hypothetical protein
MIGRGCRLMLPAMAFIILCHALAYGDFLNGQQSAGSITITNDCTNYGVDFTDNPSMTDQERLEAMDQALMRSLNRFDACQEQMRSRGAGAGGGSEAGSSNTAASEGLEAGEGDDVSENVVNSVPSSDMVGTESTQPSGLPIGHDEQESVGGTANSNTEGNKGNTKGYPSSSGKNSKVPGDIPPADNDSILEAQIREAAMNEKDPEIRDRLWNEYRRYKKLPSK